MTRKLYPSIIYFLSCLLPSLIFFSNLKVVDFPFGIYLGCFLISLFIHNRTRIKFSRLILLFITIGIFIFIVMNSNTCLNAILYLYNGVIETYNRYTRLGFSSVDIFILKETAEFYILVLSCSLHIFYCLFIQYFTFKNNKHFILFLVSLITSSPSLFFQIQLNWIWMLLLFSYWFLLFIPSIDNQIKTVKAVQIRQMKYILFSVFLVGTIFINNMTEARMKHLYQPPESNQEIIDSLSNVLKELSKLQSNSKKINLYNANNRYYSGAIHLEVTREKREELYLKYYSGANYENSSWNPLDETKYSNADSEIFSDSFEWIETYVLNDLYVEYIEVDDKRRGSTYSIYPYYLRAMDQEYENEYDIYMLYKNDKVEFQVWNVDTLYSHNIKNAKYVHFVNTNYKGVPIEIRDYFVNELGLVKNNVYQKSVSEVTEIVLDVLSNYTYTLTPGETPEDKEFVLYFMEENKKGYCVHFASAATLMFRFYGIPARYVEGYHISADQFDENMVAEVIDSDAHAWVEVFDEVYGWTPVEVTHSSSTSDSDEIDTPVTPNTPNNPDSPNTPENPTVDTPNQPNPNNQQNNVPIILPGFEEDSFISEYKDEIMQGLIVLGFILIYIFIRMIRLVIRKRKFIQKDTKKGVCEIYEYISKLSKYQEIMTEEILFLFEKNQFSKQTLTLAEVNQLIEFANINARYIYQSLPLVKKIRFKYIDCLI